jgi:hypothetical protein
MASSYARQMLRDERAPRVKRINALAGEVHACIKGNAYDAALVMQFVELETWAFLARPGSMTVHGRTSFKWFIERYMRDAPGQGYSYAPSDVYAARCGLLHTFGSLADAHERDKSVVIWRFHLGSENTFVPGLHRMAYISVMRFITDACAAVSACVKELEADHAMNERFGERLPRVFFHSGVLPSRDPAEIAALDAGIDADIAILDGTVDSDEPVCFAGHTFVRGVCRG